MALWPSNFYVARSLPEKVAPTQGEKVREMVACAYCPAEATVLDHVVPRSRGGPDEPSNLVMACFGCNAKKSDMLPSEWLGLDCPDRVRSIERNVSKAVTVRFRHKRRGKFGCGLNDEYHQTLVGLFLGNGDDPDDMKVVCAARRTGFHEEELWEHVGLIVRMRDDEDFDAAIGQLRAIAAEMRRRRKTRCD